MSNRETPCTGCHSGCCRSFAVPLTGADVLRIEARTNSTFWDFACRWADPEGQIARNYAPHLHFEDEPQTPFVLCLMHDQSENFPQTTRCRFLSENAPTSENPLGTAVCGVYEARPGACRAFPTRLNDSGQLAYVHTIPKATRGEEDPVYELCSREWTPADFDPVSTVQDLVVAKYEMAFFHKLAAAWNRQPGPFEALPDFIRAVYSQRVQLDPERRDVAANSERAA